MSAYATVTCDAEKSPGDFCTDEETTLSLSSTATQVRTYLRTIGWHQTRSGRDICPDCWSAGRR